MWDPHFISRTGHKTSLHDSRKWFFWIFIFHHLSLTAPHALSFPALPLAPPIVLNSFFRICPIIELIHFWNFWTMLMLSDCLLDPCVLTLLTPMPNLESNFLMRPCKSYCNIVSHASACHVAHVTRHSSLMFETPVPCLFQPHDHSNPIVAWAVETRRAPIAALPLTFLSSFGLCLGHHR